MLLALTAAAPSDIIFVERAQHLRRHPGQIAFPGGISEAIDGGDPVATALREIAEELGVDPQQVRVVGQLPEVEQPSSRFRITPVVGVLDKHTRFVPDGEEIAGVINEALALAQLPEEYDWAMRQAIRTVLERMPGTSSPVPAVTAGQSDEPNGSRPSTSDTIEGDVVPD